MDPKNTFARWRTTGERVAEKHGITDEMIAAEIARQRGMETAQRLVTTEPSAANVCRRCADAQAAPGHLWCQGCIDREDAAEHLLHEAGVYRCPVCLGLMDAAADVCDECTMAVVGTARLMRDLRDLPEPTTAEKRAAWCRAYVNGALIACALGLGGMLIYAALIQIGVLR